MQHQKCCYCESPIGDWSSGRQVEHYLPQSGSEEHRNDWNNLLLACAYCNGAKSDQYPVSCNGEPLLLDPSDPAQDPEDHIEFVVDECQIRYGQRIGEAKPRNKSRKGEATILAMKLHHEFHCRLKNPYWIILRSLYIELLTAVKNILCGRGDAKLVEQRLNEFREWMSSDKPYAGFARTFYRVKNLEKYEDPFNLQTFASSTRG